MKRRYESRVTSHGPQGEKHALSGALWVVAILGLASFMGCGIMGVARGEVTTASDIESYSCDGATKGFTFHFGVFDDEEVRAVLVDDDTGAATLLTLTADYVVTLINGDGWLVPGGTVTTTAASAYGTGYTLYLCRVVSLAQGTDYSTLEDLDLETLEDDFDKTVLRDRYLQRQIERAVRTPETDVADMNLPVWSLRAGKYFAFDANGAPTMADGTEGEPNVYQPYSDWLTEMDEAGDEAGLRGLLGLGTASLLDVQDINDLIDAGGAVNEYVFAAVLEADWSGWDGESWPLPISAPADANYVITRVDAYTTGSDTPELTFMLQVRDEATQFIEDSALFTGTGYVTATRAGLTVTSFSTPELAAGDHVWWKTSTDAESGTVNAIKIVVTMERAD